jgi:hypothetical protein
MKHAYDGRIAALQNPQNATLEAAIGFGRVKLDQNLVALHGGVDLAGRNENILILSGSTGSAIGPDKAVAVAVQIEEA